MIDSDIPIINSKILREKFKKILLESLMLDEIKNISKDISPML